MDDDQEMDGTQLARKSLNGQAYERLCRDLKAGRFGPGEKLKLRDLAQEMGISPTPVREALARLISEQALEQVGHHSVRVPVMDEERFNEVLELRMVLEGQAAARAALHATAADLARLEAIHERMAALSDAGDTAGARAESERFHMGVYQLARMPVLLRMVEGLWLQCGPLMRALDRFPMAKPRKQHPHLAVLRGLRRAEPEAARQGILEELERTTQPILTYLKAQGNVAEAAPARRERKTRDEVL
ncbi:GntR family transcriptional regulator [Hydrogenophaga sp.]|uniref:GntR family transcriptional regulator n=1 Tax=Hydrogenophaga sp. TaxID=1904254 RepID=UPI0035B2A4CB